jgi:RNA polymerase sigma-70 factor (ECF subfamily)
MRRVHRDDPSDQALLSAARTGDLDAFAAFVRRYERRLRAVAGRILDDERDVDECLQDAFVNAWRSLGRFREESAVSTWIYRIVVNAALGKRRRLRLPTTSLDEATGAAAPAEASPASVAERRDLERFLVARLDALPADLRDAVVLRDVAGLSNQEVADALQLSVAAAKSRIHRGRLRLAHEVAAHDPDGTLTG